MEKQEMAVLVMSILSLMVGFAIGIASKKCQIEYVEYSDEQIETGDLVVHKTNEDFVFIVREIGVHYATCYRYVGDSNHEFTKGELPISELLKIKTK